MFNIGFRIWRRWMVANENFLKAWLSTAVDASKLLALSGASVGLLILVAYLSSVGAPLPIVDASGTFALLIISAVYGVIAVIVGGIILFPFLMCSIPQKLRQHLRTKPFQWKLPVRQRLERLGSEYLLFHSSEVLTIAAISISYAARSSLDQTAVAVAIGWLVGALVTVVRLYVSVKFEDRIRLRLGRRFERTKIKLAMRVVWGSLARTLWCLIWVHFMAQFFRLLLPDIREWQVTALGRDLTWAVFGLILTGFYLMLTSVKVRIERAPLAILFFAIVGVLFYPSVAGRTVVRLLGIGGGIPVTLVVRTMQVGSSSVIAEERHGCLILNAGGRVVVQELNKPNSERCSGKPLTLAPSHVDPLEGILVYSTADIVSLTRYHDDAKIP